MNNALRITRFANIILAFLCFIVMVRGFLFIIKGSSLPSVNYSPSTIDYIRKHLPKGTSIAGNRFGYQILAYTLDYEYVEIPFEDPFNSYYTRAYGLELWSRKKAIKVFLEQEVRYVVFFMGEYNEDPFLEVGAYGQYVSSMLTEHLPEIHERSKTPDGILISLVTKEELRSIYDELE